MIDAKNYLILKYAILNYNYTFLKVSSFNKQRLDRSIFCALVYFIFRMDELKCTLIPYIDLNYNIDLEFRLLL